MHRRGCDGGTRFANTWNGHAWILELVTLGAAILASTFGFMCVCQSITRCFPSHPLFSKKVAGVFEDSLQLTDAAVLLELGSIGEKASFRWSVSVDVSKIPSVPCQCKARGEVCSSRAKGDCNSCCGPLDRKAFCFSRGSFRQDEMQISTVRLD